MGGKSRFSAMCGEPETAEYTTLEVPGGGDKIDSGFQNAVNSPDATRSVTMFCVRRWTSSTTSKSAASSEEEKK
jgi:hypothetical protein